MAWPMKRIELTFLISQRVPSLSPGLPHRDVDVGAQVALLHVAVAGAEIAQDGPELGDVGLGLLGRAQVRLGDDLHQRHAGAVEIDQGVLRVLVVDRLAGVLFEMQPLDPHLQCLVVDVDLDFTRADDRLLVLRDLIALRQVGIEVVLAVEHRDEIDLRFQPQAGAHGLRDASLVDHRQHAGHGRIDEGDMAIGLAAEFGRGAGKQLRLGGDLRVHLQADHHLPAPDQVGGGAFCVALHAFTSSWCAAVAAPLSCVCVGRRACPGQECAKRQASAGPSL